MGILWAHTGTIGLKQILMGLWKAMTAFAIIGW